MVDCFHLHFVIVSEALVIRWSHAFRTATARATGWAARTTAAVSRGETSVAGPFVPLRQVILTADASRTLFDEYAAHRQGDRGAEETGWLLMGLREADRATAFATLPAGANRDAGTEHVRFNADAQAVAGRIIRQADRRLTLLGVVHTHPGSLRHPSGGDFRGDREWVKALRGQEGVFAIGTADAMMEETRVAAHPAPHVQTLGPLRFDWYTLAVGEKAYKPVTVELTLGPDLAADLRPVWPLIEEHAMALDRLARQMANVTVAVAEKESLSVTVALDGDRTIRVVLAGKTARFFYEAGGEVFRPDLPADTGPDQGVYLILAELAARG